MGKKPFRPGPLSEAVGIVIKRMLTMSQRQLADEIGVSQDSMTDWLNGRRAMNVDQLAAISAVIGVRPGEIIQQAEGVLLELAFRSTMVSPSSEDYRLAALDETTEAGTETDEGHFGA